MKTKKRKKLISHMGSLPKGIIGITGASFGAAIGSQALGSMGGTIAAQGQKGLENVSRFIPAMGTTLGAGMLIDSTKMLDARKKGRKSKHKMRGWF